jgi:HD-like signal output (HDOD) protein
MTTKSSNYYRRNHSSRPPRASARPSNYAPFGSASTRPPSTLPRSGGYQALSKAESNSVAQSTPALVIDESQWFGSHDQAAAEDTAARSMAALVGRIIGAKPFPMSARRLADLTRQDVVRIEPVIQVLETDPGLSARLLRLVNSAGYALRQRCTSVRHAATLVGTDRLHQIATTAAVLDLFDSKGPAAAQIIEHSTDVGAFCRYLGAHLALPVDDLFTAGFLHDIGKLMLMETEGEQYVELLARCGSEPDSIHHLERRLYGFDHAALAAHVLSAWNIPDPVPKIVAWHHEPAHAYKVSSVMAALVQTIRLSDAIVYAMREDVDRTCIKALAQHEAACYLDISEPQLAAMWDELRVLFEESHQQCLGENAPALDPRSLKPRQPLGIGFEVTQIAQSEKPHDLPKQFPCVECGCPTFGNTCPACGGYVCPDHQFGNDEWCTICARDYKSEKKSIPVPLTAKWAFGSLGAAVLLSGLLGMFTSGGTGAIRAGVGTLLLGALIALVYLIGKIWFVRTRFVRSRPNRSIAEPQISDGGTHSLVPTIGPNPEGTDSGPNIASWARANVHFVEPLKEITIREISEPQSSDEHNLCLPPNVAVPSNAASARVQDDASSQSVDPLRVQMQSQSLVTLRSPANLESAVEPPIDSEQSDSTSSPRRSPRDTLREQDLAAHDQPDLVAFRKTDPGPEAHRDNLHDPSRDSRDESAQAPMPQGDATCATQMDLSRTSFEATNRTQIGLAVAPPPEEYSDNCESEVISIVKPILAIEAEPSNSPALVPPQLAVQAEAQDSAEVASESAEDSNAVLPDHAASESIEDSDAEPPECADELPESADDTRERREPSPSFHPLAVLGFRSQRPRYAPTSDPEEPHEELQSKPMVADTESAPESAPLDQELAIPIVAEIEPAPEPAPRDQELAMPTSAESQSAPEELPSYQEVATSSPIDDALVNTMAGEMVARFGNEFEARVRELVAERVAQMVTERVMAAFDVNALKHQLKDQLTQPEPAAKRANVRNPAGAPVKKRRAVSRKA